MKYSTAICIGPNCLIAQAVQKIINCCIVLIGRVIAVKLKSKKNDDVDFNMYERLGTIAHSEMK